MTNYLKNSIITLVVMFLLLSTANFAKAESIPQTFLLYPGWNAVFLEVQPQSTAPADVFAGITDLQSVWMWNPQTSTVEFIQDPELPVSGSTRWLVYYPNPEPGEPNLSNLHAIHGETPYLLNMSSAATLVVSGEPRIPKIDWKPNSFNFVGFHLTPVEGEEPIFFNFFSSSLAHKWDPDIDPEIHILDNATGSWVQVTDPAYRMKHGEAFWVYCHGSSEFTGPVSVRLEQSNGIHFGKILDEQDIRIFNNSEDGSTPISISIIDEESPSVTLYYRQFDPVNNVAQWKELSAPLDVTIPIGGSQKIRLGVKRTGLDADVSYESNLKITANSGVTLMIPISVTGISYAGLWVGDAVISKVSEPKDCTDKQVDPNSVNECPPVATGSEFSFRLILHVDSSDNVRLLSQVLQMWKDGSWKPDPNDLGKQIVDQPGNFVLLTDDDLIPCYSGATLRDGQPVGRRISSTSFPNLTFEQSAMNELFSQVPGSKLTISITLDPDDPVNPFRHMFHPDHKNTDQSYLVKRNVSLEFSDVDSEGKSITGFPTLGWGSSEIGGIYRETIEGVHRYHLHNEGTFLLRKVSNEPVLTTTCP